MKFIEIKNSSILSLLFFLFLLSCGKIDPATGEKILIEPNPSIKARKIADEGGGIFGDIGKKNVTQNSSVNFANSNILWRATLRSLDFLPLVNTDYNGGIIIYDWYSQTNNPKEQIKISVQFLDNDLRSDSIKITAHKKICETAEHCSNSTLDQKFANSIKDSIITSARALKIEESKKEKK
jgi:hypothetical protein